MKRWTVRECSEGHIVSVDHGLLHVWCPVCVKPVSTDPFDVVLAEKQDEGPAPENVNDNMLGGFTGTTSRQAALDHYPRSGTMRGNVLRALIDEGSATSDELAERHGWRLYSVKPRLIELRRGGWAEQTGETRPSATGSQVDVYRATTKGRMEAPSRS